MARHRDGAGAQEPVRPLRRGKLETLGHHARRIGRPEPSPLCSPRWVEGRVPGLRLGVRGEFRPKRHLGQHGVVGPQHRALGRLRALRRELAGLVFACCRSDPAPRAPATCTAPIPSHLGDLGLVEEVHHLERTGGFAEWPGSACCRSTAALRRPGTMNSSTALGPPRSCSRGRRRTTPSCPPGCRRSGRRRSPGRRPHRTCRSRAAS